MHTQRTFSCMHFVLKYVLLIDNVSLFSVTFTYDLFTFAQVRTTADSGFHIHYCHPRLHGRRYRSVYW